MAPDLDFAHGVLGGYLQTTQAEQDRQDALKKEQRGAATDAVSMLMKSGRVRDYNQLLPLIDLATNVDTSKKSLRGGKKSGVDPHQILSQFINPGLQAGAPSGTAAPGGPLMSDQEMQARTTEAEKQKLLTGVDVKQQVAQRMVDVGAAKTLEEAYYAQGWKTPQEKFASGPHGVYSTTTGLDPAGKSLPTGPATPVNWQTKSGTRNGQRATALFNPREAQFYDPSTRQPMNDFIEGTAPDPNLAAIRDLQKQILDEQIANGGFKPGQIAETSMQLRNNWQKFIAPTLHRREAVGKINAGLDMLAGGNRNAATQAIIIAFNRMLDDNAVREGEYNRSEALAPMISRIPAYIATLTQGGGKLTDQQLRGIAADAKALSAAMDKEWTPYLENERQGIETSLERFNGAIKPMEVFGASTLGTKPQAFSIEYEGQLRSFSSQALLDAFKRGVGVK
jgi:hypothetical protein